MNASYIAGLVLSIALMIYLGYVLARPERF